MSRRFFSEQPITTDVVQLDGPESHHLIHVMRAKVDDQVVLFDGTGDEFQASIEQVGRKQLVLRIVSRQTVDRELPFSLTLVVALPRGDRQEWLVQKAVELGVARLVPWQTQRSVARPNDKTLERLRRTVVEASKQCGRNRLMSIEAACGFGDYLSRSVPQTSLLAHIERTGDPGPSVADPLVDVPVAGVQIGVGPEGGFSESEVQEALAAGWRPVGLGPRILRTETAALTLAAQVAFVWQTRHVR